MLNDIINFVKTLPVETYLLLYIVIMLNLSMGLMFFVYDANRKTLKTLLITTPIIYLGSAIVFYLFIKIIF